MPEACPPPTGDRARIGHLLTAVLANVAALERAYGRAAKDMLDEDARWKAEELRVETASDREVLEGLLGDYHADPSRAVRMANAPGHAVAEVFIKVRIQSDPALHALADVAALETRQGALWRAVEGVARRADERELAETAALRAELHEAHSKAHLGRVTDVALWTVKGVAVTDSAPAGTAG